MGFAKRFLEQIASEKILFIARNATFCCSCFDANYVGSSKVNLIFINSENRNRLTIPISSSHLVEFFLNPFVRDLDRLTTSKTYIITYILIHLMDFTLQKDFIEVILTF